MNVMEKKGFGVSIAAAAAVILSGCGGGGGSGGGGSQVSKAALDLNTTYVAVDFLNRGVRGLLERRGMKSIDVIEEAKRVSEEKSTSAIETDFECEKEGSYHVNVDVEGTYEVDFFKMTYQIQFKNCQDSRELIDPFTVLVPGWDMEIDVVARQLDNVSPEKYYNYSGTIGGVLECIPGLLDERKCSYTQTADKFKVVSWEYNLTADYKVLYEDFLDPERDLRTFRVDADGAVEWSRVLGTRKKEMGWSADNFSVLTSISKKDGNVTEKAEVDGYFSLYGEILHGKIPRFVPLPDAEFGGDTDVSKENPFWFYFDNFKVTEIDIDDNRDVRDYEGGFGYNCMGGYVTVATPQIWDKNMSQEDLDGETGSRGTPFKGKSELSGAGSSAEILFAENNETNRSFVTVSVGDEEVNTTLQRIHDKVINEICNDGGSSL